MPTVLANNETEVLPPNTEENPLPEIEEGCNRYFFYMPELWGIEDGRDLNILYDRNALTHLEYADVRGVYFCDLPKKTKEFYIVFHEYMVWSNYRKSVDSNFILADCNSKILVVDLAAFDYDENDNLIMYGQWFYYYGNGEYGNNPVRGDGEIYTDSVLNDDAFIPDKQYLMGDADGNGEVNIRDATAIQKHLADIMPCNIKAGDVDLKNGLNIKDATAIQKHVAGIDTGYPIGKIRYA